MATTLITQTDLVGDHYVVTINVEPNGTIPQDIFIHHNTGTNVIGDYVGVCSVEELGRFQVFSGSVIPTFGNKFIRYREAKITVSLQDDPTIVSAAVLANVQGLSNALKTQGNTTTSVQIL